MSGFADTGFVASLYLVETTSVAARKAVVALREPLPLLPLTMLELCNALNLAILRKAIDKAERDALWRRFQQHIAAGIFTETSIPAAELHEQALELSDRYTPTLGTRSLDLLHVAAALLLGAKTFYSFDERQQQVAAGEGLMVKP